MPDDPMMLITVEQGKAHSHPDAREVSDLVMQFAEELDALTNAMVMRHDASKPSANAVIGALGGVLGRHLAQFCCAAGFDEERTKAFYELSAKSVIANAEARMPWVLEKFTEFRKAKGETNH